MPLSACGGARTTELACVYVGRQQTNAWSGYQARRRKVSAGRDTCTAPTEAAGARARDLVLKKPETAKGADKKMGVVPASSSGRVQEDAEGVGRRRRRPVIKCLRGDLRVRQLAENACGGRGRGPHGRKPRYERTRSWAGFLQAQRGEDEEDAEEGCLVTRKTSWQGKRHPGCCATVR